MGPVIFIRQNLITVLVVMIIYPEVGPALTIFITNISTLQSCLTNLVDTSLCLSAGSIRLKQDPPSIYLSGHFQNFLMAWQDIWILVT